MIYDYVDQAAVYVHESMTSRFEAKHNRQKAIWWEKNLSVYVSVRPSIHSSLDKAVNDDTVDQSKRQLIQHELVHLLLLHVHFCHAYGGTLDEI